MNRLNSTTSFQNPATLEQVYMYFAKFACRAAGAGPVDLAVTGPIIFFRAAS